MRTMDTGPLKKELWGDLYAFCFALTGEGLLSEQVLSEGLDHFFREDKEIILSPKGSKKSNLMTLALYRWMVRVARKSVVTPPNNKAFYKLSFNERAHLYLREMSAFDRFEREYIMECDFSELVSTTHEGRNKLLAMSGVGPYV